MSDLSVQIYKAIADNRERRKVERWHASSIAKCPRALYLERLGVGSLNIPGGGKILRWSAGHALEGALRPHLKTIYKDLEANVLLRNDTLSLGGEYDAYIPSQKELISVKSVHDYAMITRQGRTGLKEKVGLNELGKVVWDFKSEPYTHHQWQEHAYILMANHKDTYIYNRETKKKSTLDLEVEKVTYIYITLSGLMDTFTTSVNPDILKRVTDKVEYLNQSWEKQEPPVCLCQEGQEMFQVTDQYCDYRSGDDCCSLNLIKELENA